MVYLATVYKEHWKKTAEFSTWDSSVFLERLWKQPSRGNAAAVLVTEWRQFVLV